MIDELKELQSQEIEYMKQLDNVEKLYRLYQNQDFIDLFLVGYCIDKCSHYVEVATATNASTEVKDTALEAAKACGHLKNYINYILREGRTAQENLDATREAMEQLQSGE